MDGDATWGFERRRSGRQRTATLLPTVRLAAAAAAVRLFRSIQTMRPSGISVASIAHPRTEHFAPLFVAMGAAANTIEDNHSAIDGFWFGLSKRSVQFN